MCLEPRDKLLSARLSVENETHTNWLNRAGQAFRMAAGSVMRADCAFGAFYRRQKARLGPAQAAVATAHLIARVVHRMLTLAPHTSAGEYKVEYEPLSVAQYDQHYRQ